MGGGEEYAPRTPLAVASPQQLISGRQRYLVAQEKFAEPPLTAIGPQRPAGNSYSCLTMLPYLVVIWEGPGP